MGLYNGSLANYYGGLEDTGSYQFISVTDIINNFRVAYVGEDKIIPKISRADIKFHALRGVQELSYDTFRSCKTLELEVPPSLLLLLPHDYVEYTKISWIDSNGKCHPIHQCKSCPKDPLSYKQNDDGTVDVGEPREGEDIVRWVDGYGLDKFWDPVRPWRPVAHPEKPEGFLYANLDGTADASNPLNWGPWTYSTDGGVTPDPNAPENYPGGWVAGEWVTVSVSGDSYSQDPTVEDSTTWANAQGNNSANSDNISVDSEDNVYQTNFGQRYGLDPQHANINGCFWINCRTGKIHFDSNLAGKTVIIQYISDGVATDDEMIVHKFAEEAMYKHIAHAILNTRANTDRNIVATFKKERSAAVRNAKIRLSSIKLEEITQILRGKSKWIKH
tara:strand:- start:160 stop:1326 length:1167 start_codon:yes stop_codon:yes gene_type:complete